MSWPYEKCAGVRVDGERCSSRAGFGSLYCHHHDPARDDVGGAEVRAREPHARTEPARGGHDRDARAKPAALRTSAG